MRKTYALLLAFCSLAVVGCTNNNAPVKIAEWENTATESAITDYVGLQQNSAGDLLFVYQNGPELNYRRISATGATLNAQSVAVVNAGYGTSSVNVLDDGGSLAITTRGEVLHFDQNDTLLDHYSWFDSGYIGALVLAIKHDRICLGSDENSSVHLRCVNPDGSLIWETMVPGLTRANGLRRADLDGQNQLYVAYPLGNDMIIQAYSAEGAMLWQVSETEEAYPDVQSLQQVGNDLIVAVNVRGSDNVARTRFLHLDTTGTVLNSETIEREIDYLRILPYDTSRYILLEQNRLTGAVTMRQMTLDGTQRWSRDLPAGGVGMGSGGLFMLNAQLDDAGNIVVLHNVRNLTPALVDGVLGLSAVDNFSLTRYDSKGGKVKEDVISRSRYKVGELGAIVDGTFGYSPLGFVASGGQYFVAAGDVPPDSEPDGTLQELIPAVLGYSY